jgi:hypothetical protein
LIQWLYQNVKENWQGGKIGCLDTEVISANTCLPDVLLPLYVNQADIMDFR